MIALTSKPTPAALARLAGYEARRAQAAEAGTQASERVMTGYRHKEVKEALLAETAAKCAYCESRITHVYFGDVEHILPKDSNPDLLLSYDNLTIACAVCNNKKDNYYNPAAPLLNPYEAPPEQHLLALGVLVWHRPGSEMGERTRLLLDLNRAELVERRQERLESVARLADKVVQLPKGPVRGLLERELNAEAADQAEYAFIVRTYLAAAAG